MKKTKFLIIGGINTIFGYIISLLLYKILNNNINLLYILILSNIISITFSFLMYKKIVFKTPGNWFFEYLKCYIVYGFSAVLNIITVIILIKYLEFQYWFAQGIAIVINTIFSYYSHSVYTFKNKSLNS
jgi:putative flippase GtrA